MIAFKAYSQDIRKGCVLVYASNRQDAQYISSEGLYEWEVEDITVMRVPTFDNYYNGHSVILDNSELPIDAPNFYSVGT